MKEARLIPIKQIQPNPYQPRKTFNDQELKELAQSILENGLIQPISVRKVKENYQIVAGERRFRAVKLNKGTSIEAVVLDANDIQMAQMALVENIQRENLTAIDEASSFVDIMKISGINQVELALQLGKSQSAIANKIRLLHLNEHVQEALRRKQISERHGRALLQMDEKKQQETLDLILKKKLNVVQTEKLIQDFAQRTKPKKKAINKGITRDKKIAINTILQATKMVQRTGTKVLVKQEMSEDEIIITIHLPK